MKLNIITLFAYVLLPIANFFVWYFYGISQQNILAVSECEDKMKDLLDESLHALRAAEEAECESEYSKECSHKVHHIHRTAKITTINSAKFDEYRSKYMASNEVTGQPQLFPNHLDTLILQPDHTECKSYEHEFLARHDYTCMAVVYIKDTNASYNIVRFDGDIDINGIKISNPDPAQIDKYSAQVQKITLNEHNKGKMHPGGYFRRVPKDRGRERTKEKMWPFLKNFKVITEELDFKLNRHGIKPGDDAVVMVVNEGEIDLFLNFACSCRLHNISLNNMVIFAGSQEIVNIIEATGAIGLFHEGYASVSKKPSVDYLDRVFVDMMWFKAFSIYLLLRKRINVLFQDVDLVWFHEPFKYFKDFLAENKARSDMTGSYIEAFFTDDGQRSMRYTPFYANSGFYYFLASERSEYFAWSIMIAFDAVQVLGSHQNVFTTKLVEGLSLGHRNTFLLPLSLFPNGIMYHHDRPYMNKLYKKEVSPYHFHMCWTQGKPDKLKNLRLAKMWYLHNQCSPLDELIPDGNLKDYWSEGEFRRAVSLRAGYKPKTGKIFMRVMEQRHLPDQQRWDLLSSKCCTSMPGAP